MNRTNGPLTSKLRRARHGVRITRGSSSSSLAHARVARITCALSLVSLCIVFMAQSAFAATWPMSTSALSATLDSVALVPIAEASVPSSCKICITSGSAGSSSLSGMNAIFGEQAVKNAVLASTIRP